MANPNIRKGITKPSDEDFHYVTDKVDFHIPSISKLDPTVEAMEAFEGHEEELGALMRLVRSSVDDKVRAAIGGMRVSEFGEFAAAWGEHSGTTLGN